MNSGRYSESPGYNDIADDNKTISARRLPGCRVDIQHLLMADSMSRYVSHDDSPRWIPGRERRSMEGQIELLDYLESLEKKGFDILDYIPTGQDHAVTRSELCRRTGLNDRVMRVAIHKARRQIPILNMQDGKGYFIPDMNVEEDRRALKRHVQQEESRLKNIGWALREERRTLRNCGIDWREDIEQQKQGSERRT